MYGKKLKNLRLKKNLTVRKLAEKIGISPGAISHLENDRHVPSKITAERLEDFFGLKRGEFGSFNAQRQKIARRGRETKIGRLLDELCIELEKFPVDERVRFLHLYIDNLRRKARYDLRKKT